MPKVTAGFSASRASWPRRLHQLSRLLPFCFAALIGSAPARAQTPAAAPAPSAPAEGFTGTGSLTGRVKNIATGKYLDNARVTVQGTSLLVYTDATGTYNLAGVPAGDRVLHVLYTGLDEQSVPVTVASNQTALQDVNLTSASRYGVSSAAVAGSDVVKIDPFVVAANHDTDIASIATNEQRFAPNIKDVISTEALGDTAAGGSAGDFLRYLPGVAASTTIGSALETGSVNIRGFPSNYSVVEVDGVEISGSNFGGGRTFSTNQVGVNEISRVEVTKVPLPSTPADTMSGAINMITKSAFEYSGAQIKYQAGVATDDQHFDGFKRVPIISNKESYPIYPNAQLTYIQPIGKNFGIAITGATQTLSTELPDFYDDYISNATTAPNTGTSPSAPYLWRVRNVETARDYNLSSASVRLDWRATEHSVLTVTTLADYYGELNFNQQWNPTVGEQGTSTIAGGTNLSYSPTQTIGATGRGSVAQASSFAFFGQLTQNAAIKYALDDGVWKIDANLSDGQSRTWRRDTGKGFWNALSVGLSVPVRVTYNNIDQGRPNSIQVFDNNNNAVDPFNINNYNLTAASKAAETNVYNSLADESLDVRRKFNLWSIPTALQIGGSYRVLTDDDKRVNAETFNYNGINGSLSAAPYLENVYYGSRKLQTYQASPYVPWVSNYVAYDAFTKNPALFTQTVAQQRATLMGNIINSKYFQEKVDSTYIQGEMRFLNNRLLMVTGVRFEGTKTEGQGPLTNPGGVYQRTANGLIATDPTTGLPIRLAAAGAASSIAELPFIYTQRGITNRRSYSGYYPSLHFTLNILDNLLLRAGYAETYGRPDLSSLIPNTTLTEDTTKVADPGTPEPAHGSISYTNPNINPWTAQNYDVSLEWYTPTGGVISIDGFDKQIKNFFGSSTVIATGPELSAIGLDPVAFLGYTLTTQFNAGDATVKGAEINFMNSLELLGPWGKHIQIFANATKLKLKSATPSSFVNFLPENANWGVTLNYFRTTLTANWAWRGEQNAGALVDYGPNAFQYVQPWTRLDLSLDYAFSKRLIFFTSLRNVGNEIQAVKVREADTPAYAQFYYGGAFGRQITAGIKGTF